MALTKNMSDKALAYMVIHVRAKGLVPECIRRGLTVSKLHKLCGCRKCLKKGGKA